MTDITVCSVQSLSKRLTNFDPEYAKLILIDEAHNVDAFTYHKILDYFDALTDKSKVFLIEISATISQMDEFKLGRVFDEIIYHRDYNEMIGEKWLFSLSEIDFETVWNQTYYCKAKPIRRG